MNAEIEALFTQRMSYLAARLTSGEITLGEWNLEMREAIRRAHALQLVAGANGDKANVAPDDWLRLGPELRKQYRFLTDFAREIQAGQVQATAIAGRAELYAQSAKTAYWDQVTKDVRLPTMPGRQRCLGHCGCSWVERDGAWYWVRGLSDSCEDCLRNEQLYNPYIPESA